MYKPKQKEVYISNQNFLFDFTLLHCGYETEDANVTPQIFDRFALSYLTEGAGYFISNGKKHLMKKGDIYLITPGIEFYQENTKDPYKYIYIGLYGANCPSLFEKAGFTIDKPVMTINNEKIEELFCDILKLFSTNTFSSIADANLLFIEILCFLFRKREENNVRLESKKTSYMQQAAIFIENNIGNKNLIQNLSKYLFLSRSYLSTMFKEYYGTTLKHYITNIRIAKATLLIKTTNTPIIKIAKNLGFEDYPTFYKCFFKKLGLSPKKYQEYYKEY
ncbi:MAG: helix-turn-helix domain-containing protein [Clostridiales bacterium]|nr:helix-turn-helix domain-containing protein [Clostridiales bacterium]